MNFTSNGATPTATSFVLCLLLLLMTTVMTVQSLQQPTPPGSSSSSSSSSMGSVGNHIHSNNLYVNGVIHNSPMGVPVGGASGSTSSGTGFGRPLEVVDDPSKIGQLFEQEEQQQRQKQNQKQQKQLQFDERQADQAYHDLQQQMPPPSLLPDSPVVPYAIRPFDRYNPTNDKPWRPTGTVHRPPISNSSGSGSSASTTDSSGSGSYTPLGTDLHNLSELLHNRPIYRDGQGINTNQQHGDHGFNSLSSSSSSSKINKSKSSQKPNSSSSSSSKPSSP